MTDAVTAVIVNYRTPDLARDALDSFRSHYAGVPLLLIDNGSGDGSAELFRTRARTPEENLRVIENRRNIHHGPAMDQALRAIATPLALFLDSDCVILRGGFLEAMVDALAENSLNYAVGKKIRMNRRGFDVPDGAGGFDYIRPICMLLRREFYFRLAPFERHGAPCLRNMRDAADRGFGLVPFAVEDYIRHRGRGTAGRFGYRLGLKGLLNHALNRLGL